MVDKKNQDFKVPVQAELIRTLYSRVPTTLTAFVVLSSLFVVLLWNTPQQDILLLWLVLLYPSIISRLLLCWAFMRLKPKDEAMARWRMATVGYSIYFGLVWGATAPLFIPSGDIVSFVTVSVVLLGLSNASGIVLSPYLPSLVLFNIPVMGLFLPVLIGQGDTPAWSVLVVALVTLIGITSLARETHRSLLESLRLRFENIELRHKEEEKSQRLETANHVLKLREQALDKARQSAEQANMAKTRFLAAASHDLRQPMHALGLSFTTLADKVRNGETAPLVRQVENSIEVIDTMLNALLDISKLDADVVTPNMGPVSVNEMLDVLDREHKPMARQLGNRLYVRLSHTWIISDPSMLKRILQNLIGNALRYTSNGRVLVVARRRGDNLRIEVHDTGIGIPEDRFDDIFVEFQQLGNPQRDRSQGLGLGLAIVKRLAVLLGHSIEVKSKPGHGSCFAVSLPLMRGEPPVIALPQQSSQLLGNELLDCRILLLDDDISVRESMQSLLEHWGCQVFTAANIEDADTLYRTHSVDILIVDYRLPGELTGLDAIVRLRKFNNTDLPALVITGDTAPERLREAQDSGYPLLHKPVQPAKLRSTLRQLIKAASQRVEK